MLGRLTFALCLAAAGSPLAAQDAPPAPAAEVATAEVPDLTGHDRDTLLVICQQLYARVHALEAELAAVRQQVAAERGGEGTVSPDGTVAAIDSGAWIVTIQRNTEPDPSELQAKIQAIEQETAAEHQELTTQLAEARTRERQADAEYDAKKTHSDRINKAGSEVVEGTGVKKRVFRHSFSEGTRDAAKSAAKRAENDRNSARREVSQLERQLQVLERKNQVQLNALRRELEEMTGSQRIEGETDKGLKVVIIARNDAVALAPMLAEGGTYRVTGRGQITADSGRIYLESVEPAE